MVIVRIMMQSPDFLGGARTRDEGARENEMKRTAASAARALRQAIR
jgi:hypothetical protein